MTTIDIPAEALPITQREASQLVHMAKDSSALVLEQANNLPLGKIAGYTAATLAALAVAKIAYDKTIGKPEPEPQSKSFVQRLEDQRANARGGELSVA